MKKIHFAFLCFTSCIFNVQAQYIFNSCGNRPVYGDSLTGTLNYYDSTGVTSGSAGANITWNYTNLTLTTTERISHYYYDPSTLIDTSASSNLPMFPTATLADLAPNGVYSYYRYSPDSVMYLGDYRDAVDYQVAVGPEKQIICPFSFTNSFNNYFSLKNMGMCTFDSYINKTITYDAYGTLNLGLTSFSVVRLKIVEHTIDTSNCSIPPIVSQNEDTTYMWFDITTGQPVFSWEYYNDTSNHYANKTIEAYSYSHLPVTLNTSVQPLAEQQTDFTIYPNPTSGEFQIQMAGGSSSRYKTEIYNMLGKKVFETTVTSKQQILHLDAPGGVYFIHITTPDGTSVKKMVLE